ncbi:unnamed protein product [Nezara viridula]|uniref:Uncharacterized protein n=1 Tax=Nezara viridula TaxID=85310 RepID=A0A9P0HAT3_NEZVI|nr:unnamed protein product [Nezara viridula]
MDWKANRSSRGAGVMRRGGSADRGQMHLLDRAIGGIWTGNRDSCPLDHPISCKAVYRRLRLVALTPNLVTIY